MDDAIVPEITPAQLAARLADATDLVIFDVREPFEVAYAHLDDSRLGRARLVYTPLSELARSQQEALPEALRDPAAEIVVLCHLGMRSAQVTAWLRMLGYEAVFSLAGGINAYALEVDASIPRY